MSLLYCPHAPEPVATGFQFSLRSLLLAAMVAAFLLAVIVVVLRTALRDTFLHDMYFRLE